MLILTLTSKNGGLIRKKYFRRLQQCKNFVVQYTPEKWTANIFNTKTEQNTILNWQ